jgi:hypothetical protein
VPRLKSAEKRRPVRESLNVISPSSSSHGDNGSQARSSASISRDTAAVPSAASRISTCSSPSAG